MTTSLALAFLWLIAANVTGMVPSRKKHWPQAYLLIAVGLPILFLVFRDNGPLIGLAVLLAAASILRWPVRYALRWITARLKGAGT